MDRTVFVTLAMIFQKAPISHSTSIVTVTSKRMPPSCLDGENICWIPFQLISQCLIPFGLLSQNAIH